MMKYIKKGDQVIVVSGNDKGQSGEVLQKKGDRILVKGVNVRKRHRRQQNAPGKIIEVESPVHLSNVAFTPDGKVAAKLRCRENEGKREVYYRDKAGNAVVHRTI